MSLVYSASIVVGRSCILLDQLATSEGLTCLLKEIQDDILEVGASVRLILLQDVSL